MRPPTLIVDFLSVVQIAELSTEDLYPGNISARGSSASIHLMALSCPVSIVVVSKADQFCLCCSIYIYIYRQNPLWCIEFFGSVNYVPPFTNFFFDRKQQRPIFSTENFPRTCRIVPVRPRSTASSALVCLSTYKGSYHMPACSVSLIRRDIVFFTQFSQSRVN